MNRAHESVVNADTGQLPPSRPFASWYTQGRSDGIGDRLLMADNTGTAALELLRFRPELAATYGFEGALRDRVERLSRFRHAAFPEVHAVEYLEEGDGLALVTTHTPGKRVADLLPAARTWPPRHAQNGPRAEAHPAFATWLIRGITAAVADLQAQGHEIAHGALTADRIVLTPDRRVVIVEHVLGSALASLQLSPGSLWAEVGVVSAWPERPVAPLDPRTDVVQIGLVSLSVLLGRRITPAEYPARLRELLDEFSEVAARRSPGLVARIRLWLELALRTDGRGFKSAREARGGLGELDAPGHAEPETRILDMRKIAVPDRIEPPPEPEPVAESAPEPVADLDPALRDHEIESRLRSEPELPSEPDALLPPPPERQHGVASRLAAAFAALALVEAVVLAVIMARRAPAPKPVPASVPIQVAASDADVVMIDGRAATGAPLQLAAGSATHTITVVHKPAPVEDTRPQPSPAPRPTPSPDESRQLSAIAQAAARQRSGGLRLISPIELQVFEGDRVLGTTADGPVVAAAGVHELDLVNAALGFRLHQTVQIKAGQIVSLAVTPPNGRVSVNAVPWAQVWIDGNAVGETPLANLSVPAGEHEIVFRHPQLGEHREKAVVKSGVLTRVSATLGR